MNETIISVGIDLGTSTTQLVFSKITVENLSSDFAVPRINIVDKEVIYRSEVYFTPLNSPSEINAQKVKQIISTEYLKAGIKQTEVDTGAVIITGETARKDNASQVLTMLSEFSGEFVVATAGPDLESALSGKGAGTDKFSEKHRNIVANLDIGGGTTNLSVFQNGQLVHVSCLDIGGRLIKIEDGKISYVFHKVKKMAADRGIRLEVGESARPEDLKQVCIAMTDLLSQLLSVKPVEEELPEFFTNGVVRYPEMLKIDALTFSGGVAKLLYEQEQLDYDTYGDIGVLLAEAIRESEWFRTMEVYQPKETIQATVVGAGIHTTELSGSTINYDKEILPLKNIPVIRIKDCLEYTGEVERIYRSIHVDGMAAVFLEGSMIESFMDIQQTAEMLIEETSFLRQKNYPMIIIFENDFAKAVGNAIRVKCKRVGEQISLLCIDGIQAGTGDYIDIGEPIRTGRVLPVIVKTLIFNH